MLLNFIDVKSFRIFVENVLNFFKIRVDLVFIKFPNEFLSFLAKNPSIVRIYSFLADSKNLIII
jgi:hypothetical protein